MAKKNKGQPLATLFSLVKPTSAYIEPRNPETLLTPISIFENLNQSSKSLWTRSLLLATRAPFDLELNTQIQILGREVRRLLILEQSLRFQEEDSTLADSAHQQLLEIVEKALALVPPGRFSYDPSLHHTLSHMTQQLLKLRHRLENRYDEKDSSTM